MQEQKIYTHDKAVEIVDMFEDILSTYDIHVPSPEDDERDEQDFIGLYGSTYSDLLDSVEAIIVDILNQRDQGAEVLPMEECL